MEKATIVYGPRNSGKSTLIQKMMKDYKNPLETDYNHFIKGSILSSYMGVEKHTDVISICMPPQVVNKFIFQDFFNLIGGKLVIDKQGKQQFTMDTPKLIFEIDEKPTFPGLSEGFINSKFEFIECTNIEVHNRVQYKEDPEFIVTGNEKTIDWKQLRTEFFAECVDVSNHPSALDLKVVNMNPHNLFLWFKNKIEKQ